MRMKRCNEERIVDNEEKKNKLLKMGFRVMGEPVPKTEKASGDFTKMSVAELKATAKARGVEGYSSLSKEELIYILREGM